MYIRVGVNGGFISMVLFILIIVFCFRIIGSAVRIFENNIYMQKYIWAIGASFFTHIVSFMGVSYFGQMIVFFYLSVAVIAIIYYKFI